MRHQDQKQMHLRKISMLPLVGGMSSVACCRFSSSCRRRLPDDQSEERHHDITIDEIAFGEVGERCAPIDLRFPPAIFPCFDGPPPMDRCDVLYYCTADHHKPHTTTTETMMNAFATRVGTKLMAPALVGAVSGLTLYNTSPTVHAAAKPAVDLKKVKEDIADLIENDAEKRGDGTSLTGTFVRLAWHCSGSFSKEDGSGGSNGARMRFNPEASWGANAGLGVARDALEPIKEKHPEISYADLYTLAGVVAVEESGGPTIPYRLGREDFDSGETSPPDGRLPDADKGSKKMTTQHVRDVFYRMGFNDREIVALLGAHALGRCHKDRSGYWGPWTFAENTMSNEYFRLLLEERWTPKTTHNGKPWTGPPQFEDSTGKLMMLPSDMILVEDPKFKKYVEMYVKDEDLFFKDFAKAFSKLLELGVPFPSKKWFG